MSIQIHGLNEVDDFDKLIDLLLEAFADYPKLKVSFADPVVRMAALEAVLRFYGAYDLKYGKAYSLDEELDEAALVVESTEMGYTFLRHLRAGSYAGAYRRSMAKLTFSQRRKLKKMFAELDRLERTVPLPPHPYLYVDFLGVRASMSGQGKGRRLMEAICGYAGCRRFPVMLFTNTEQDIRFYKSLGFEIAGVTHSDRFGFTNTYMVKPPD